MRLSQVWEFVQEGLVVLARERRIGHQDSRIAHQIHHIVGQLSTIGKRKTNTNPDFLVAFYAKSVAQTRWRTAGYGGQFGATAETYEVGTLVVDVVSRRDGRAVWRGVATKTLSSKKRNEKAIREACAKLAKQFKKDTEKQMKGK